MHIELSLNELRAMLRPTCELTAADIGRPVPMALPLPALPTLADEPLQPLDGVGETTIKNIVRKKSWKHVL